MRWRRRNIICRLRERFDGRLAQNEVGLVGCLAAFFFDEHHELVVVFGSLRKLEHAIEIQSRRREERRISPSRGDFGMPLLPHRFERIFVIDVRDDLHPLRVLGGGVLERRRELHLREKRRRAIRIDVEHRRDVATWRAREKLVPHALVCAKKTLERRRVARGKTRRVLSEIAEFAQVRERVCVNAFLFVFCGRSQRKKKRRRPFQIRLAMRRAFRFRDLGLVALQNRVSRVRVRRVVRENEELAQPREQTHLHVRKLVVDREVRRANRFDETRRRHEKIRERRPELVMKIRRELPVASERGLRERDVLVEVSTPRLDVENALAHFSKRTIERRHPTPNRRESFLPLHSDLIVGPNRATKTRPRFVDRGKRANRRFDSATTRMDERAQCRRPEHALFFLERKRFRFPSLSRGRQWRRAPKRIRRRRGLLVHGDDRRHVWALRNVVPHVVHRRVFQSKDRPRSSTDERARSITLHAPELRRRNVLRERFERFAVVIRHEHTAAIRAHHESSVGEHVEPCDQSPRWSFHGRERIAVIGRANDRPFRSDDDDRSGVRDARDHQARIGFRAELSNFFSFRDEDVSFVGRNEHAHARRRDASDRIARSPYFGERGAVGGAHEEPAVAREPEDAFNVLDDPEKARASMRFPFSRRNFFPGSSAVRRARGVTVFADDPHARIGEPRVAKAAIERSFFREAIAVVGREKQIASLPADCHRLRSARRDPEDEIGRRSRFDRRFEREIRGGATHDAASYANDDCNYQLR